MNISQTVFPATRVALVAFNSNVTYEANLTSFNNRNDLMEAVFTIPRSPYALSINFSAALEAAERILQGGRNGVKQAVFLYASRRFFAFSQGTGDVAQIAPNPTPLADQIKSSGAAIITTNVYGVDGWDIVSQFASPNMNFSSIDEDLVEKSWHALSQGWLPRWSDGFSELFLPGKLDTSSELH